MIKKNCTREEYYDYIRKLEQVIPDDELRDIGRNFGLTKRKDVIESDICRVVPGDWIFSPQLIDLPKDNNIMPEHAVKTAYAALKRRMNVKENINE